MDNGEDVSLQLSNDLKQELKLEEDELVKKYDGKVLPDYLRGKLWQVGYIVAGCLRLDVLPYRCCLADKPFRLNYLQQSIRQTIAR